MKHLIAILALSAATAATAVPAISVSNSVGTTLANPPFTLGWSFTVVTPVRVTALGFFDSGQDGLVESHALGLWDASGTLLATGSVSAGTSNTLVDFFRYVSVTPVNLATGNYTIGALFTSGLDGVHFPGTAGTLTVDPRISFGGATFAFGGVLANPTLFTGGEGYIGPNMNIAPVPEPATWAMLIAGFGLVGYVSRRRRVAATA